MSPTVKRAVLSSLRYAGAFRLARALTRRGVRVLCYHGISLGDEHRFRGRLFMRPETFAARMRWLEREGYPVLSLREAVAGLDQGGLPANATVITFDDAWYGVFVHALPLLRELGFPATLYATTQYSEGQVPVFNVTVRYLLWRAPASNLDLARLDEGLEGAFDLRRAGEREQAANHIIRFGRDGHDLAGRCAILRRLAVLVGIEFEALERSGTFRLMSLEELAEAQSWGFDIELHTHRHGLGDMSVETVSREIEENRQVLATVLEGSFSHFCYPGGLYGPEMWPALRALGILTAVTCEPGFNYPDTERLALRRILDEDAIAPLEFEGELSGAIELMRNRFPRPQQT